MAEAGKAAGAQETALQPIWCAAGTCRSSQSLSCDPADPDVAHCNSGAACLSGATAPDCRQVTRTEKSRAAADLLAETCRADLAAPFQVRMEREPSADAHASFSPATRDQFQNVGDRRFCIL